MKDCYYIAEIFLPNKSAYSTHVIKMCNELSLKFSSTELLLFNMNKNLTFKILKKKYILRGNKHFFIKNIFQNQNKINFIKRIIFGLKVVTYLKNKERSFIITRSLMTSFFLSLFKIYHRVEIHNEIIGLTKFLLINLNFLNSQYVKKVIFISSKLSTKFKVKRKIILHDAVDITNFKKPKFRQHLKNVGYLGSFYNGRGIELIIELAKQNLNLNFYLIGKDKNFTFDRKLTSNIKVLNHVPYAKVPNLLFNLDILLMPYQKIVQINSKSLNTALYCSPLKMFDYLASGKIIISSNLPGITEILKDKTNSLIVDSNNVNQWSNAIRKILKNKTLSKRISLNAYKTAIDNTWEKRANKMILN
jgi:glycosyltransferase involved in cell wall biosynthesis